jgi:hypothetical protein
VSELKCFICSNKFKRKSEIFRNLEGYPVCEDCLWEELDHYWLNADDVLKQLKQNFSRDHRKYKKDFDENYVKCAGNDKGKHGYDEWYIHKDSAIEVNDKFYCELCYEELFRGGEGGE